MTIVRLSKRWAILFFSFAAVASALAFGTRSAANTSPNAALQRDLASYLKTRGAIEHLSSLSLAVSYGAEQPTITVTSGTTTYGGSTPVNATSLYQIGSNTKAFTAVAILQLEAKGRLSIDDPIGKYLPQYPAYAKLTLRRLLNMTGGLESYDNLPSWESSVASHPMANIPAHTLIRTVYPHVKYTPGSKYYYSNTGYIIAQEVVAALSDSKSFSAEIDRIINSVGLKHTFYTSHLYPPAVARDVVAGYYEQDDKGLQPLRGRDISGYSLSWAQGAGSMVSTPADLITWARALYSGTTLLPAKQKAELISLISTKTAKPLAEPTAGDPAGFGLGVAERYDSKLGGRFWFYQGETLGFRAVHLYYPSSGLVVTIFANSRPVEAESHIAQLFAKLYTTIKKYAPKSA
ncbi:MAG: serine hydrolase domain-containing protein [Candidatus Cybelea sp.]